MTCYLVGLRCDCGELHRLAQALSALYPAHSDEKRRVNGVLGPKKGLRL